MQLYLNDSAEAPSTTGEYVGGATSFLSSDEERRLDVNPKAGSDLIFQYKGLYYEGAKLIKGTKYAMRTDILYKWCREEEVDPGESQ